MPQSRLLRPRVLSHRAKFLPLFLSALLLAGLSSAPARAADPIKIGFGMGLTGGLAASGKAALLGMKIWEEEINAKGGLLGRPVQLIYYDDQSNPATVPGIYTKLLDIDKVDLVTGDYGTNLLAPAKSKPSSWKPATPRRGDALPPGCDPRAAGAGAGQRNDPNMTHP